MNNTFAVHAPLTTTTVWVDQRVFFNMQTNPDEPEFIKSKLFGITCNPGRVPTFEIITESGYVFSEVPPHMLFWKEPKDDDINFHKNLQQLVYNNCLSEHFSLSQFPELQERHAFVLFKDSGKYMKGSYWFSLDFYKDNNWFHCLKLENGNFVFMPSHKIVFSKSDTISAEHKFPAYQKFRQEFKV